MAAKTVIVFVAAMLLLPPAVAASAAAESSENSFDAVGPLFEPTVAPESAAVAIPEVAPAAVLDPNAPAVAPSVQGDGPDALAMEIAGLSPGDEVVSLRSDSAKVFVADSPGLLRAEVASGPVHYQRPDGSWAEIDPTLRAVDGVWRSGGGVVSNEISTSASGELAAVVLPGGQRVGWSLADRLPLSIPELVPAEGPLAGPLPSVSVTGDVTVRVPGVRAGVDLELVSQNTGVKETLVLASALAPRTYVFHLELDGVTARLGDTNGAVEFVDGDGAVVAMMPPGFMEDSSGSPGHAPAVSYGVSYGLTADGDDVELTVSLDEAWLSDPGRVFPVRVDPTTRLQWEATEDTYVVTTNNNDHVAYQTLSTGVAPFEGNGNTRSFIRFGNLNANFGGATVMSADVGLWTGEAGACSGQVYSYGLTQNWSQSGMTYANQPTGVQFVSADNGSSCPGYRTFSGWGSWVNQWVQGGSNFGLTLRNAIENTQGYWACQMVCVRAPHLVR